MVRPLSVSCRPRERDVNLVLDQFDLRLLLTLPPHNGRQLSSAAIHQDFAHLHCCPSSVASVPSSCTLEPTGCLRRAAYPACNPRLARDRTRASGKHWAVLVAATSCGAACGARWRGRGGARVPSRSFSDQWSLLRSRLSSGSSASARAVSIPLLRAQGSNARGPLWQ
jgi:hypothetical protein